jgi:putative two-component system response regulator
MPKGRTAQQIANIARRGVKRPAPLLSSGHQTGFHRSHLVARILIVDDEREVRRFVREVLETRGHAIAEACDVAEGRQHLAAAAFDLVLCDIALPGETGLVLVRQVAAELPDTAIIMVSGAGEPAQADEALALGACGYLVKPFRPNELVINVAAGLRLRDLERGWRHHSEELESKVLHRTVALHDTVQQLEQSQETAGLALRETADRLVTALTLRSEETGEHIQRMSRYGARLAIASGVDRWSEDEIRVGMMLHDVGKIGVPDAILLKPGVLTSEEYEIIKRHPAMGADLLGDGRSEVLSLGAQIALSHHERWDGRGYPGRLAGKAIPMPGRIAAIADVFDALTSDRVYHAARPVEQALEIMADERARHFDPDLLDVFQASIDDMIAIRDAHPDPVPSTAPIRVLIAESRPMFADALVRLLAGSAGISVTGVVPTLAGAVAMIAERGVDVIVLDVDLPEGPGGMPAIQAVRGKAPDAAVILLAGREDEGLLRRTIDAGGSGIIQRDRAFEDLLPAVAAAAAGASLVPSAKLAALFRRSTDGTAGDLTSREMDVLRLMAEGLSNDAIGGRLGLRVNTVRNHGQRILTKLDAHSKLEAVAVARRRGLFPAG